MSESKFDPKRRLCPDGSCIGVIGADGRCAECGRASGGQAPTDAEAALASAAEGQPDEADSGNDLEEVKAASPTADGGFDPKNRRLCEDGTCVGLVGVDGRCNVCGMQGT